MAEANGYISRGNMTIILSSAGLIMVAFGAFVTQQNNATDRQISRIEQTLDKTLRKDEHEEFKLRLDKDITRLSIRIEALNLKIVPRQEVDAKAVSVDNNLKLLSDRLNELRTATASTYTIRDEVHRMQAEMSELRKLLSDRALTK